MWRMLVLASCMALLVGCETESKPLGGPVKVPANLPAVTVGSVPEYDALVAKHQGEVILVDFWATWCGPCVESFPHTVELAQKYRAQGLAAISVSLDDPDELATVQEFLAMNNAQFDHLLSKDGPSSESMEAFGLNAAVPHYRLIDRAGKVRYDWDGLPDELAEKIEELLSEK